MPAVAPHPAPTPSCCALTPAKPLCRPLPGPIQRYERQLQQLEAERRQQLPGQGQGGLQAQAANGGGGGTVAGGKAGREVHAGGAGADKENAPRRV